VTNFQPPDPSVTMTAGVRPEQFQMLNWGTFDGAVHRLNLHSGNTLLTGQVGSGKSTIVDGLTALFAQTNKVTFNRAAGAERSERTVATYVRGTHRHVLDETTGATRAESLRPGKGTYTVLLATFTGVTGAPSVSNLVGDDGTLTAGIVFWFTDNDANPSRFHFLAPTRLDIGEHLLNHANVRALKATLRSVDALTFDAFRDYQKSLCRCLNLRGDALDLLVQTISMKQVGNLTDFVRNHMLDTPDVKTRIARVLEHYGDLLRSHELVQVAKAQLAHLNELAGHAAAYDRAEARIQAARTAAAAVPALAATTRVELLAAALEDAKRTLPILEGELDDANADLNGLRKRLTDLEIAIANEGGADLRAAERDVNDAQGTLERTQSAAQDLDNLARQAGIATLADASDRPRFTGDVQRISRELEAAETALHDDAFNAEKRLREARDELARLNSELKAAGTRDSNVPMEHAALRHRLADAIGVDDTALPYVAELLAVVDHASEWEAAAERLVRGFALSVLVPEQHYQSAASWVDANNLRGRLDYHPVPAVASVTAAPAEGTIASVLQVRPGQYATSWVRAQIDRRFDHALVDTPGQLKSHPRAVTRAGQIKQGTQHTKDDRHSVGDRRNYVLGWDTASRRAYLQAAIPVQQQTVDAAETEANRLASRRSEHGDRRAALKQISERYRDLSLVDVGRAHERLREAQELYALFFADSNLAQMEDERNRVRERIAALDKKRSGLEMQVGDTQGQVTRCEEQLRDTHMLLAAAEEAGPLPEDAQAVLDEAASEAGPRPASVTKIDQWATAVRKLLDDRAASSNSTREREGRMIVKSMTDFAHEWREAVRDMRTDDIESRSEYLAIRDRLERDDLPRFEQNFRDELQRNAIQEIVGFSVFLDTESKKITGRIDTINNALHSIDYRPGTHIKLEAVPTVDPIIREFKSQLKDITSDTLFEDAYAEERFLKVKELLDRFSGREGQTTDDQRWTARVTDVRNWFSFAASERMRDTDEEIEHYEDSGGKSGGQKEKLAYTVLAASLAYQYGLAGGRADAFRFVMIDEAFGRGSDDSTRYGLQLFGQLGLQLLVVTPLQKVGTIEPFVEAVGYVYPAPDGLRSRLLPMTISEFRERRATRQLAAAHAVLESAPLGGPAA